jgi:hypothetical protein
MNIIGVTQLKGKKSEKCGIELRKSYINNKNNRSESS